MPTYDYPFNERVRSLLRIEDLLLRVIDNLKSDNEHDHFLSLQALLQLTDVIDRAEIKLDLLQELIKQKQYMELLQEKKVVDPEKISILINDLGNMIDTLQNDNMKLGQHLRTNEWLMNIKQRHALPGGISKFDFPSFQHWLSQDPAKRRINISTWVRPLLPMQQAVFILLHILRGSGKTKDEIAKEGTFHHLIGNNKPSQMLRIRLPENTPYYPEVSANKYAINVRFHALDYNYKQQKVDEDVLFNLTLCNF